jgi:hypothetical protein
MTEYQMAEFFRSLGHKTVQTESCFWYSSQRFLYKNLPIHRNVDPSRAELAKVMLRGTALVVRYPGTPGDDATADGGIYSCADRNYDFASLTANARSHTRRGLARNTVEQVDFKDLAVKAYPLIQETNVRQTGKQSNRSAAHWKSFCELSSRWQGLETWAAFVDGELAAFIVAMLAEDCYYIHLQKSASSLLKHYSNNALLFTVMKSALARPSVGWVSNGQIALAAKEGLYHFKTSMGFQIHPFKERVVFNPVIRPGLWAGRAMTSRLAKINPENLFWRRASRALELAGD